MAIAGWDARGQAQQPTAAGHQPALDLGNAERRVLGRHDQIGGQRQLGAAGQRVALDGGDQRLDRRTLGEAHPAALDDGNLAAGERLEVHARTERAARAGHDAHRKPGVSVEPVHRVGQTMGHRGVDRVLGLGPVDGDDQNPVPLFDEDFGFAGGFFSAHDAVTLLVEFGTGVCREMVSSRCSSASITAKWLLPISNPTRCPSGTPDSPNA